MFWAKSHINNLFIGHPHRWHRPKKPRNSLWGRHGFEPHYNCWIARGHWAICNPRNIANAISGSKIVVPLLCTTSTPCLFTSKSILNDCNGCKISSGIYIVLIRLFRDETYIFLWLCRYFVNLNIAGMGSYLGKYSYLVVPTKLSKFYVEFGKT